MGTIHNGVLFTVMLCYCLNTYKSYTWALEQTFSGGFWEIFRQSFFVTHSSSILNVIKKQPSINLLKKKLFLKLLVSKTFMRKLFVQVRYLFQFRKIGHFLKQLFHRRTIFTFYPTHFLQKMMLEGLPMFFSLSLTLTCYWPQKKEMITGSIFGGLRSKIYKMTLSSEKKKING